MRRDTYCLSILAIGFVLCVSQPSRAVLVVGYDAVDSNGLPGNLSPSAFDVGVFGSDVVRNAGLAPEDDTINDADYVSSSWSETLGDSLQFSFFTFTTQYDLDNLQVHGVRGSTGPQFLRLDWAPTGSSTFNPIPIGDTQAVSTSASTITFDLSSFDGITEIHFRLTGLLASDSNNGLFSIVDAGNIGASGSDLVINGTAVPEPAAFLFGALVCGVIGLKTVGRRLVNKLVLKTAA